MKKRILLIGLSLMVVFGMQSAAVFGLDLPGNLSGSVADSLSGSASDGQTGNLSGILPDNIIDGLPDIIPDIIPDILPDNGTDDQKDNGTDGQNNNGTDGQNNGGTDDQNNNGTDSQNNGGTDDQNNNGTDGQNNGGTDSQTDSGNGTDGQNNGGASDGLTANLPLNIGTTSVDTAEKLKTAFDAGKNIKLEADITINEQLKTNKNITISLNGHTLTTEYVPADPADPVSGAVVALEGGKITVKAGLKDNNAIVSEKAKVVVMAYGGSVELQSQVQVRGNNTALKAAAGGTVNIKDATVYSTGDSRDSYNYPTVFADDGSEVSIRSGQITSEYGTAVMVGNKSKANISGGTLSGEDVLAKSLVVSGEGDSEAEVTGGTFKNQVIAGGSGKAGRLSISGGTFNAGIDAVSAGSAVNITSGTFLGSVKAAAAGSELSISGGTFKGENAEVRADGGSKAEITGGTFNGKGLQVCARGASAVNIAGGTFGGSEIYSVDKSQMTINGGTFTSTTATITRSGHNDGALTISKNSFDKNAGLSLTGGVLAMLDKVTLRYEVFTPAITVAKAVYNGKAQTPAVTVKKGETQLKSGTDYKAAYANNTNAGSGQITITGVDSCKGTVTKAFTISKAGQSVKNVTPLKKTVKANRKTKKLAKAVTFKLKAKVTGSKDTKVTFKKTKGSAKIKVAGGGKVTLAKGLKKGKYTVKVKVTKAGNANYKKAEKTVTLKVTVK